MGMPLLEELHQLGDRLESQLRERLVYGRWPGRREADLQLTAVWMADQDVGIFSSWSAGTPSHRKALPEQGVTGIKDRHLFGIALR